MRYMVVEHYVKGPGPVYEMAAREGRMLPDGLRYVDSWVVDDERLDRCFQLMEADDPDLFQAWVDRWAGLVEIEIHPVVDSTEAARRVAVDWDGDPTRSPPAP